MDSHCSGVRYETYHTLQQFRDPGPYQDKYFSISKCAEVKLKFRIFTVVFVYFRLKFLLLNILWILLATQVVYYSKIDLVDLSQDSNDFRYHVINMSG